eukprot:3568129-Pyramimonas_sp.AAC.1
MQFHGPLKLWYCRDCAGFGANQILKLGQPCLRKLTSSGIEYLDRISRGLWPKVLSRAEQASRRPRGVI